MHYSFSDEQEQFRASLRRFLERHSSPTEVRRVMDTERGHDDAVWRALASELGVTGLHLPEDHGGGGFGFTELGIACEEMGRTLLCAPFLGSAVLGARAVWHGGGDAERAHWLPAIGAGETIAALAFMESNDWNPDAFETHARRSGDAWCISGRKTFVLDGLGADLVVCAARTGAGTSLFVVEGTAAGLTRRPLQTIDRTRRFAALEFEDVPGRLLGEEGTAPAVLARVLDEAAIALACEMIGGARTLLEMSLEYAGLRMQFGRLIGSFQAIKHKCADRLLEIELAAAAACYAAAAVDDEDPELAALASAAKALAADAYMHMAEDAIQIHGGIGFTWDHDAHLWYRRAKSSEVLFGTPAAHRARYVEALSA